MRRIAKQADVIEVIGQVAMDDWESRPEWPPGRRYAVAAPLSRRHPHARRVGFLVADSHADRHYGEGAVLFCIERGAWSRKLRRGDRVVVRIRESGQIMNLCMVVDISAAGDIVLTTASTNPRQRFEALIRRDRSNGRQHGFGERSYFKHLGERPAEIDYAPRSDDAVTIDRTIHRARYQSRILMLTRE